MAKLADLRALLTKLAQIDAREITSPDDDPGLADRERAGNAVAAVIEFLRLRGTQSHALDVLNAELLDLARTWRRGPIFSPPRPARRQPVAWHHERSRGYVAAVVELKRLTGPKTSRRQAAMWVLKHIPKEVADAIADGEKKGLTVRAIESWHSRYSQPPLEGESVEGHDAYCVLLNAASGATYSDDQLVSVLTDGLRKFSL